MSANPERTDPRTSEVEDVTPAEQHRCPECAGRLAVDEARGDTACTDCGLVVEQDAIDTGPEWRSFDLHDSRAKSRVGAPRSKLIHDEGLSTTIGWQDKDAYGTVLSPRQRKRMHRLRTWDERFRTKNARDRNLRHALGEIDRMASALGLPTTVRETAGVLYRRALAKDLLLGRSIEGMATAVVYAAARLSGTPRSLDDCVAVSRVDRPEVARTYRYLIRELGLEVEPTEPERFVPRLASELGLSDEVERRAVDLLESAREQHLHSGKSPVGLAAAAVYAASLLANDKVTQEAVGDVANISEVTIRNRYNELLEAHGVTADAE